MKRSEYRRVPSLLAILPALAASPLAVATNTQAQRVDTATGGVSALAGGAAFIPGSQPVTVPVAMFMGFYEGGYLIGRSIFDPPDPINAGISVEFNAILAGHEAPPAAALNPGIDAQLASALDASAVHVNRVVASNRAIRTALDRYEGALMIGNGSFASARLAEANFYLARLKSESLAWQATIPAIVSRIDALAPSLLDSNFITPADVLSVTAGIASTGVWPSVDSLAISTFQPTAAEYADVQARMGLISVTSIDTELFHGAASLSYRQCFLTFSDCIASGMQSQQLPTPGAASLALIAALGLGLSRRRHAV